MAEPKHFQIIGTQLDRLGNIRGVQIEISCRKIQITCSKIEICINRRKIASDSLPLSLVYRFGVHSVSKGIDFNLSVYAKDF